MFSIYVNEKRIDLVSQNLVLNETLFNINNPSQRNVLFSNNISLAKTANNIEIFSLLSEDVFNTQFEGKVYWKTVLVSEVSCSVKEIKENTFKIQMVDELSLFYRDINKKMHLLEIGSEDYVFDSSSYTALENNLTGSLFYPLVDFRGYNNAESLIPASLLPRLRYLRHVYLVKNVLTQIIEDAGHNADLSILDNDLCFTSNHERFFFTDTQISIPDQTVTEGDYVSRVGFSNDITPVNGLVTFGSNFDFRHDKMNSRYGIEITLDTEAYMYIRNAGTSVSTNKTTIEKHFITEGTRIITEEYTQGDYISISFDRDVDITDMKLLDLINEVDYYTALPPWPNGDTVITGWTRTNSGAAVIPLLDDYYIKASYNLPDMTQKSFVLEFFKLYNMFFSLSGGTITLKQNELGNAINIKSSQIPTTNNSIQLPQNNYFKYTNDIETDNLEESYAEVNKVYDNGNETIEQDIIELGSSASLDVHNIDEAGEEFDGVKIPIYDGVANIESDRLEQSLRFFLIKANTTNIEASYIGIFQEGLTDSLNFENLYDRFYKDYYDFIENAKSRPFSAKLTFFDWLKIRASGKIYHEGSEYTVLQINKFNPNRLTQIKAITREVNG